MVVLLLLLLRTGGEEKHTILIRQQYHSSSEQSKGKNAPIWSSVAVLLLADARQQLASYRRSRE